MKRYILYVNCGGILMYYLYYNMYVCEILVPH